jgi:hypothetical protein
LDDRIALDSRGLGAALGVLRREQSAYLPTKRETGLYRAFNVSAFSMLVAAVLLVAAVVMGTGSAANAIANQELRQRAIAAAFWIGGTVAALSALGTLVLFVMNLSLIRKLYRLARLRRRLRLVYDFTAAFSAERKTRRLANAVSIVMSVFGVSLASMGLFAFAGVLLIRFSEGESLMNSGDVAIGIFSAFAVFGIGLGFASLHFVRRGKRRLEVVLNLEKALGQKAASVAAGSEAAATLSTSEYNALAGLERQQIIRDRASSIVAGRREAKEPGYSCQTSRQMYLEQSKLPPETRVKVEQTVASLLENPAVGAAAVGAAAAGDAAAARHEVAVVGTSLRILYDVDPSRHLVRLLQLETKTA